MRFARPAHRSTCRGARARGLGVPNGRGGGPSFLGGRPPAVDLDRERLLADVMIGAAREGLIESAHDLSDAGLAAALVESCLHGGLGAHITVPEGADPFVF